MVPLLWRSAIWPSNLISIAPNEAKNIFHKGVLIERVHYYAILAEEGRTIQEVVLIEKGALTKEYGKKIQNSGSIVVYAALLEEIQGHSDWILTEWKRC